MPNSRFLLTSLFSEKEHGREYAIHRQRLSTIKKSIDNNPPPTFPHLQQRLKKAQMEEERCAEIERDNRNLVLKMADIMKKTSPGNAVAASAEVNESGYLKGNSAAGTSSYNRTTYNNVGYKGIDNSPPHSKCASLNKYYRKKELARITKENHALLKRLQEQQPTYNHLQWEQDREKNEQLCERICKHPYALASSSSTNDSLRRQQQQLPRV